MLKEIRGVIFAGLAVVIAGLSIVVLLREAGILDGRLIIGILLLGFAIFIGGVFVIVRRYPF